MTAHHPLSSLLGITLFVGSQGGCLDASDTAPPGDDERLADQSGAALVSWIECASEGGTCSFAGTRTVRYGTPQSNTTKTLTNGTPCNNGIFGDPAYGTPKKCWYAQETVDPSWTECASEGGTCSFSGTRNVLYGASTSSQNTVRTLSNGTPCGNAVFGDPAYGIPKKCWVGPASGQDPNDPDPTYAKTRMFRLANPNLIVEAGQDTVLTVRFFAATPLPDPSKIFTHLMRDGDDNGFVADVLHHWEWIPTGPYPGFGNPYNVQWNGYVEFDYAVNIPVTTPPGTYRITSGLAQGVSPYWGRMDGVDCNDDAPRVALAQAVRNQTCVVGRITVTPQVHPPSTVNTTNQAVFAVVGRSWSP